ncbi:MAG: sulfatase, partial [Armatimonadota bacterium]
VCGPSRVNFITGRYPHSHGSRENNASVGPGEPHMFRVLRSAGYRVALVGKNHTFYEEDLPRLDFAFTEPLNLTSGSPEAEAFGEHINGCGQRMRETGCWAGAKFHDFPEELTSTHRIADVAMDYLRSPDRGEPFLLWVSFPDPHAPHTAPSRLAELYPLDGVPLPEGALASEEDAEVRSKAARQAIKRKAQGMVSPPEAGIRRYMAVYSAMVSFVDEHVGRILDELERQGLADSTIVVYTSDHGDFRGDHGMVKKDLQLYDCLLNIPCAIRFPGTVEPRRFRDALAQQIDVYPTLLDYVGVDAPRGIQGRSLRPLLEGEDDCFRDEVFAEICPPDFRNPYRSADEFLAEWHRARNVEGHPLRWTAPFNVPGDFVKMIRTATRKYIWYADGESELYDLERDPGETVSLADDPACADDLAALRARLFEWHVLTEDPLDSCDARRIATEYPW